MTLNDNSINGGYGDMTFAGGVATFVLKHGEIKTAHNLPAKITYEVIEQEANQGGYTTSSVGEIGTITADATANVTFKNHKGGGGGPSDTYTSVSVKKGLEAGRRRNGGRLGGGLPAQRRGRARPGHPERRQQLVPHLEPPERQVPLTVEEIAVPDGFTVSINREPGNRFVITNDDKPGAPDDPDNPDDPDDPDNPDNPDEPDDPDEPDKPVNPDNPDTPDTPDQPDPIEVPDPPVPTDTVDVPGTPNDAADGRQRASVLVGCACAAFGSRIGFHTVLRQNES